MATRRIKTARTMTGADLPGFTLTVEGDRRSTWERGPLVVTLGADQGVSVMYVEEMGEGDHDWSARFDARTPVSVIMALLAAVS
jgi:hypothetical protein